VGLQFTYVCFIAWPSLGADSSAVGLCCVTIPWFTSSYDSRRSAARCCFLLNADILADIVARQWLLIAVSHVALYCVKRSQSESIAMQPQVWNIYCKCETECVTNVSEWIASSSVVQLLFTCGPFYKNVTTCEPFPMKWCIKQQVHNIEKWKREDTWVRHWK